MRSDPGPSSGRPRWILKDAPAARSASAAGRPSGPARPSNTSPREWATMNQGGIPAATSAPIIDPADVPTMNSALPGSQSVSFASALSPPVSHAPPSTPPAPSTNPTLTDRRFPSHLQGKPATGDAELASASGLGLARLRVGVGALPPWRLDLVGERRVGVAVERLEWDQTQALAARGALVEVAARQLRHARPVRCGEHRRRGEARHPGTVARIVWRRSHSERHVPRMAAA